MHTFLSIHSSFSAFLACITRITFWHIVS